MDDFASDTDSDYTSYWRDWVSLVMFYSLTCFPGLRWGSCLAAGPGALRWMKGEAESALSDLNCKTPSGCEIDARFRSWARVARVGDLSSHSFSNQWSSSSGGST